MKVFALLLGHLVDKQPFYVYRVPENPLLFYKISDIAALFRLPQLPHHPILTHLQYPSPFYFRDAQNLYVSTRILLDVALSLNKFLLAELCKLKETDYAAGFAESILNNVHPFQRAKIGDWIPMDLSTTAAATTSTISTSNNNNNIDNVSQQQQQQQQQQNGTPIPAASTSTSSVSSSQNKTIHSSPKLAPVKIEPQSPTLNNLSASAPDVQSTRRRSESTGNHPSKRQRISKADSGGQQQQQQLRAVMAAPAPSSATAAARDSGLPKPMHTVGSQGKVSSTTTSALLAKRLASRQGKHAGAAPNLTIYPASYAEQSTLGVRSAPLNSNFFHQQMQQPSQTGQQAAGGHHHFHNNHHHHNQHPSQQTRYQLAGRGGPEAPRTGLLMPGHHNLAPLLSPRAPLNMSSATRDARKQEFAIPPIVPSQQQPPLSAHNPPSSYHAYMASPNVYTMPTTAAAAGTLHPNGAGAGPKTASLPTTAAAVALPPQTPTTLSFGSLQKQQFMQPFEHLFETIETTRTLKSTLDDQIRRSSTLMQTLQASSTTIEGLIRNQIKEAQKDLEATLDDIVQRIEKLERSFGKKSDSASSLSTPPPPPPSSSNTNNTTTTNALPPPPKADLRSPPTVVRSQNEIGLQECQDLLHALRERLDRLERQRSS